MNPTQAELNKAILQLTAFKEDPSRGDGISGCCGSIFGYLHKVPKGIDVLLTSENQPAEDYIPKNPRYVVKTGIAPLADDLFLHTRTIHVDSGKGQSGRWSEQPEISQEITLPKLAKSEGRVVFVYIAGLLNLIRDLGSVWLGESVPSSFGATPLHYYAYIRAIRGRANMPNPDYPLAKARMLEAIKEKFKGKYVVTIEHADTQSSLFPGLQKLLGWENVVYESPLFNNMGYDLSRDYLKLKVIKT